MKNSKLLPALILALCVPRLHAEDARMTPENVLSLTFSPVTLSIADKSWDGSGRITDQGRIFINAGLAVDYGAASWLSPFARWMPGLTMWSSTDAGPLGYGGDFLLGIKAQILGAQAPLKNENMRLAAAAALRVPLPSRKDGAGEISGHLWGAGFTVFYDYIFSSYFSLNTSAEIFYNPEQWTDNPNFGTGRINSPVDFSFTLEPRTSFPLGDGSLILEGGLPFAYSLSAAAVRYGEIMQDSRHNFSLGPDFSLAFTKTKLPFELGLGYRVSLVGINDFASHTVMLRGKIYIPLSKNP
jgi:hypothetical protein